MSFKRVFHLPSVMMFDLKARLVVVPTVAELELKITHIFALQCKRFYKQQLLVRHKFKMRIQDNCANISNHPSLLLVLGHLINQLPMLQIMVTIKADQIECF